MVDSSLALQGVSFSLPDGRTLFSHLDIVLDRQPTALVGRNGVGKSVLARILAGQLSPTSGRRLASGVVHYLPQQIHAGAGDNLASVAGVRTVLDALTRIEHGSVDEADFERVGERWNIRQQLQELLRDVGLGERSPECPADALSGGELTRLALAGAWLAQADFLILDEPSNHLDRRQRQSLWRQLRQWSGGLLVVSHDRELLGQMQRIIELSPGGLRSYGGDYRFYRQLRDQERAQAVAGLERVKQQRRHSEQQLQGLQDRQRRQQSHANRQARQANQAPILQGGARQRSEQTAGRQQRLQLQQREQLDLAVREAARQLPDTVELALFAPQPVSAAQRHVAELDQVVLAYGQGARPPLDLVLRGCQRIGVTGANGSGKSSLLKLLAGDVAPASGQCRVQVACRRLDQQLAELDPLLTPLQALQAANPPADPALLRGRLSLLGLAAATVETPLGRLSGGERLKTAMACVLYAEQTPQLLLLDEPSNHLDLDALEALEQMLRQYPGALMVVSHDAVFLDQLALDTRLHLEVDQWQLSPW